MYKTKQCSPSQVSPAISCAHFDVPYVHTFRLSESIPLPCPVRSVSNIAAGNSQSKEDELQEKPGPATAFLGPVGSRATLGVTCSCRSRRVRASVMLVEVVRSHGDEVVVIRKLARLCREAEVGNRWDLEVGNFKALSPVIFGLVLKIKFERLILEVGEASFGGNVGIANASGLESSVWFRAVWLYAYRATSGFVGLPIIVLVIRSVSVTIHSHDPGKHGAWTVVLVCVEEDTQALKLVYRTKNRSFSCALFREPHGESISVKTALAGDLELNNDLLSSAIFLPLDILKQPTSQLVAVKGTRENIHPVREGLSDARRTYWSVRMMVSPPNSHHRLCMSESRYGYAVCVSMRPTSIHDRLQVGRLTGSRLCVRN